MSRSEVAVVRNPNITVQVNLRIKESLRRDLEREADKHQTSLNNEMRLRLEDSLKRAAQFDLVETVGEMNRAWERFGERFLRLRLENDLIEAMAKSTDPEVAKAAEVLQLTERGLRRRREREDTP
jgi:hypothetical protein